ncbi:hypothetical protein [Shinella zoogloeoides]|uniref:hypothetical protein n=1 Tax=Shinella zoogloeoides TaxID=352475 RepID=UPI00273D7717|nr:hypothetical protein [Shinella zoogloeoides]WLR90932.1 hypothetical protein Q9316_00715 [Shinella zoogloeoides]
MITNRMRLEFAAEGFLRSMRRSYVARHPDRECPIKPSLSEYSEADRGVFIAAVESALALTAAKSDQAFANWSERRFAAAD